MKKVLCTLLLSVCAYGMTIAQGVKPQPSPTTPEKAALQRELDALNREMDDKARNEQLGQELKKLDKKTKLSKFDQMLSAMIAGMQSKEGVLQMEASRLFAKLRRCESTNIEPKRDATTAINALHLMTFRADFEKSGITKDSLTRAGESCAEKNARKFLTSSRSALPGTRMQQVWAALFYHVAEQSGLPLDRGYGATSDEVAAAKIAESSVSLQEVFDALSILEWTEQQFKRSTTPKPPYSRPGPSNPLGGPRRVPNGPADTQLPEKSTPPIRIP